MWKRFVFWVIVKDIHLWFRKSSWVVFLHEMSPVVSCVRRSVGSQWAFRKWLYSESCVLIKGLVSWWIHNMRAWLGGGENLEGPSLVGVIRSLGVSPGEGGGLAPFHVPFLCFLSSVRWVASAMSSRCEAPPLHGPQNRTDHYEPKPLKPWAKTNLSSFHGAPVRAYDTLGQSDSTSGYYSWDITAIKYLTCFCPSAFSRVLLSLRGNNMVSAATQWSGSIIFFFINYV